MAEGRRAEAGQRRRPSGARNTKGACLLFVVARTHGSEHFQMAQGALALNLFRESVCRAWRVESAGESENEACSQRARSEEGRTTCTHTRTHTHTHTHTRTLPHAHTDKIKAVFLCPPSVKSSRKPNQTRSRNTETPAGNTHPSLIARISSRYRSRPLALLSLTHSYRSRPLRRWARNMPKGLWYGPAKQAVRLAVAFALSLAIAPSLPIVLLLIPPQRKWLWRSVGSVGSPGLARQL